MSNLQNTAQVPLRVSMTNKGKSHALMNDLLERKTRALGGSLNKLKLTTQRDQTKSTIETNHRNRNKEMPQNTRDKPAVNLLSTKSSTIKQMIKCGQCEKHEAKLKCLECLENYCTNCFTQFHLRGALQRHHRISLSTSQKKSPSLITDNNPRELSDKQSNDDLHRKLKTHESEELHHEKTNLTSFQQSFLEWRDKNIDKSQRIRQKNPLISPTNDRIEYSNKLPQIESTLAKKDQHVNQNNQESSIQRAKKTNITQKDQSNINVLINIRDPFSDNTNLNDPTIDTGSLNNDLSTKTTADSIEIIKPEENSNNDHILERIDEEERPITHISIKSLSRPTSSLIKKDSISSRPTSITLVQQSLRSLLTTKSTDELEAIVDSQLILSRPTSSISEKLDQSSNWLPVQNTSNNTDVQSNVIDQNKVAPFDLALDESKIESAYRVNYLSENVPPILSAKDQSSTHVFCMNSTMATPRRNSPFSFTNSLYRLSRINSASSRDTGDGGFFTDVLPQQIIPPPPPPPPPPPAILECSTSNEWKHALENQSTEQDQTIRNLVSLRKLSFRSLSRASSKNSVIREEIPHRSKSQIDNNSRPGSSLSSASLPVSIASSKADFNNSKVQSSAASSRKSSSSTTSTNQNFSSSTSTPKNSSSPTSTIKPTVKNSSLQPEPIIPMKTEDKKIISPCDPNECHQKSTNSLKDKSSSNVHASESANDLIESNLITFITREENITGNDLPAKKRTRRRRRQTTNSDDSSKFRKLEFSVGDGLKWQETSMESMYSTETISSKQSSNTPTPRALTPSNPINTKLAEQFSKYDNDDGRSSRTYQNMNDEECFNQLREELCSELDLTGSDEDAILNDQILKLLQVPFNEKDLRMIETKLRENEPAHQPSIDNELFIHE